METTPLPKRKTELICLPHWLFQPREARRKPSRWWGYATNSLKPLWDKILSLLTKLAASCLSGTMFSMAMALFCAVVMFGFLFYFRENPLAKRFIFPHLPRLENILDSLLPLFSYSRDQNDPRVRPHRTFHLRWMLCLERPLVVPICDLLVFWMYWINYIICYGID